MTASSEILFGSESNVAPIGIIAMSSVTELGKKIDDYLVDWAGKGGINVDTFLVQSECPRFSSGDGKGMIKSTIRGKDLFIIIDVGNYSIKYDYFGMQNAMSPDDHFQDLKRIIQAASGKAHRITVIMPTLYGGRQHRRSYRESLDCACALQELEAMGVSNIVTFDAHDPRVQNAIPLMGFDNVMPTYQVLKAMLKDIKDINFNKDKFMVVSPDEGALNRNMYYASVLGVEMGMFYKRRDYSTIVNGRNPIVAHEFLGDSVEGLDILIVDDMISSGDSMLDIAREMKERGARKVFCAVTFGLFTEGIDHFNKAYEEGIIDKVFATNLVYRRPELLEAPWFADVNMCKFVALLIDAINHDASLSNLINPTEKIKRLLKAKEDIDL